MSRITYAHERLIDIMDEVKPLLVRHWGEIGQADMTLDPDYDQFLAMEAAGMLAIFTVRADRVLVGYSAFIVRRHLHYREKVAINDVVFLVPEHRGVDVGRRLMELCDIGLRGMGAMKVFYHVKLSLDWSPLLIGMGYAQEEKLLAKRIQ